MTYTGVSVDGRAFNAKPEDIRSVIVEATDILQALGISTRQGHGKAEGENGHGFSGRCGCA